MTNLQKQNKDILIPKTREHLRHFIVGILQDVKGDNIYPSDQVLQANASVLYTTVKNILSERDEVWKEKVKEIIGEDEDQYEYTGRKHVGRPTRLEAQERFRLKNKTQWSLNKEIHNNLRSEQRKKLEEFLKGDKE